MKKSLELVIGIAVLVAIVLALSYFAIKLNNSEHQLSQAQDSIQTFESVVTEQGKIITKQEQRIMYAEKANDLYIKLIDSLYATGVKNVSTIINLKTEIKRLQLELSYKPDTIIDTIVVEQGTDLKTYLRVPQLFEHKNDPWFYCNGTIKSTGATIDSMIVFSQPSIVLGWETSYLKKSKPIVVFQDQNPYTVVTDMNNLVIQQKPKFYKRPWWYRLEGGAMVLGSVVLLNSLKF